MTSPHPIPTNGIGRPRKNAALSPDFVREVGQLRPDNHELWKYLQRRIRDPVPVAKIAAELKLDVNALVAWMLAYQGPKRKLYQSKTGAPISPRAAAAATSPATETAHSVRVTISPTEKALRTSQAVRYGRWRGKPGGRVAAAERG